MEKEKPNAPPGNKGPENEMQERFLRIARMFEEYREDEIMRELCRLAIKCAQERWICV